MTAPENFESFINQERERLDRQRQKVLEKRKALDEELEGIDRELEAVSAYERIKTGKAPAVAQTGSMRRGRRSGRRQEVLNLVKSAPTGLSRAEIIEKLDVKGDRKEEQSISNALSALKRADQLNQQDGKYVAA